MKMKQKADTGKEANTSLMNLPLPIAIQLYWKRKVKINNTKPVLKTCQNLLQII
jgi:hypothetical protein